MWSKYVTRRLAVQVAQAWNFGWGKAMEKVYGVSVKNTLVFRDSQKTEYYVNLKQYKDYIKGLYDLLRDDKFVKEFHEKAQKKLEKILKETKLEFSKDLSKLSNDDLLKIYTNFVLPNLEQFYIRMWTVFNINEPLAIIIRELLLKFVKNNAVIDEYLLKLSSPIVPNDVLNERIDLLKIVSKKNKIDSSKYNLILKKHTKKYKHIPMFDFDHEPYSFDYFFEEANKIKKPENELSELIKVFKERKAEIENVINEIKPDKYFLSLIKFLQENVVLRDYRDMIRQKYNLELRKFYFEVGKRLGLNIKEVSVLTDEEIVNYLKKEKLFPKDIVSKRVISYLLIQKGNKVQIYSGNEAISKVKSELNIKDINQVETIQGKIGSKGRVRGRVVVVYTNKDLKKVKEGDVIIATMTRQDFVPAIRKSSALITDEGSVICHAAIIAREFKIPCVVGAKIATKVFKDGDLVEVDANKGIVRKLN